MEYTGIRMNDSVLDSCKTVEALLRHIQVIPKARTLVDAFNENDDLLSLPNVTLYATRIRESDKHDSVGRWKVIEEELKARGLPTDR